MAIPIPTSIIQWRLGHVTPKNDLIPGGQIKGLRLCILISLVCGCAFPTTNEQGKKGISTS